MALTKLNDLNREQRSVLATIVREANRVRDPKKRGAIRKSAIETGIVEANLENPASGDGTSVGWRQETASSYPNVNRRDVAGAARRYVQEAERAFDPSLSSGQLAQKVQRSAFPDRYDKHAGEASALARAIAGGKKGAAAKASPAPSSAGRQVVTSSDPVTSLDPATQQILAQSLGTSAGPSVPQPAAAVDPWFTARRALPSATGATPGFESTVPQAASAGGASLDELVSQLAQTPADAGLPAVQTSVVGGSGRAKGSKGGSGAQAGSGGYPLGTAKVAAGADRAGAHTQPITKKFVALVAGKTHSPVTITTGTNHDRMTVDGNVSDHWTGHAADIGVPVDSHQGDVIASAALQLVGVKPAQAHAMVKKGGLWTFTPKSGPLKGKRVQVIWRTYEGGDHHNHVHLGVRDA